MLLLTPPVSGDEWGSLLMQCAPHVFPRGVLTPTPLPLARHHSWTVAMKRANEFGTKTSCETSQVTDGILKAFNQAQKAIRDKNMKGLEAATTEVQRQLLINYAQVGRHLGSLYVGLTMCGGWGPRPVDVTRCAAASLL